MFYGTWKSRLDKKGRMGIPKCFGKELGKTILIVSNGEDFLLYPGNKIEELAPKQLGQVWLLKLDKQGRIVIPRELRVSNSGEQEVILVGWGDHFKINLGNPKD